MATKAHQTALEIKATADKYGFSLEIRGGILTIRKSFAPGREGFLDCDMFYGSVLELLPQTSAGSTWGTDGGGIGGMVAMDTGRFVMNKSGGSKAVLNALAKVLAQSEL